MLKRLVTILGEICIIFSIATAQQNINNVFIEPEVQYYFEKTIGYKKYENQSLKDSPISVNLLPLKNELFKGYSVIEKVDKITPKPVLNYDNFPLYYDLKIDNVGPISSCVLEPSKDFENKVVKYSLIDMVIYERDLSEFYNSFLKKVDFYLAGEQEIKDSGKNVKIVFGWIRNSDIEKLKESKIIKSYRFSYRKDLRAPLKDVVLIVKAPLNRNIDVFINSFIGEIQKNGFEKGSIEKAIFEKNSKFSLIKITGRFPIDKIDSLMGMPFVFKLQIHS